MNRLYLPILLILFFSFELSSANAQDSREVTTNFSVEQAKSKVANVIDSFDKKSITGKEESFDRPNILWLTFEDTSPEFLKQYGNPYVQTPTIDALAREGTVLTQARATAPQCSPARSSIISGSYATTYGTDVHRQNWTVPGKQYFFPTLLQEAGYFTSNNRKTDYNTKNRGRYIDQIWSEQGRSATYNNASRKKGQPFFSVFNLFSTHMSRIRSFHTEGRRDFSFIDEPYVQLPSYVPNLEDIRSDYAFVAEGVNDLDKWVSLFVEDLKKRKLMDDTIIFIYSDHGGPLPRAKGYPYDSGFRVPMIVWVPEKWQDRVSLPMGERSDRLVGFEDLGPSVLGLAGVEAPDYLQGQDVISDKANPKEYQYNFRTNHGNHYYPARTVTDGTYQYVRSYIPHKPLGLAQFYQWGVPGYQAWDRWCHQKQPCPPQYNRWFEPMPTESLFNIEQDPGEMYNLADDPQYQDVLKRMRGKVSEHIRDTKDLGFFPRSTRVKKEGQSLYEWVRNTDYPLDSLHAAAEIASSGKASGKEQLVEYLGSSRPEIRFWGASGLATLAQRGLITNIPEALSRATSDENKEVAVTAGEALFYLGDVERGMEVIFKYLRSDYYAAQSSLQSMAEIAPNKMRPYVGKLHEMTDKEAVRSALVALGELEYEKFILVGNRYKKGLQVNKNLRSWRSPSPNPDQ